MSKRSLYGVTPMTIGGLPTALSMIVILPQMINGVRRYKPVCWYGITAAAPRFVKVPNLVVDVASNNYLLGRLYHHPFRDGDVLPLRQTSEESRRGCIRQRRSRYRESLYCMLGRTYGRVSCRMRDMLTARTRNRKRFLSRLSVAVIPSVASRIRSNCSFS